MGKKHKKKQKEEKNSKSLVEKTALCDDCGRYFNRELSWLKFNERILEEARSIRNPLLERVGFLGIVAGNLDEFFMVRVPAYQRGATRQSDEYEEVVGSRTQLEMIYDRTIFMMRIASWVWAKELKPELEKEGIVFQKYAKCSESEKHQLRKELSAILAETPVNIIRGDRFQDIEQNDYLKGMGLLAKSDKGLAVIPVQDILDKHGRFATVGKRKVSYLFREDVLRKNSDLFLPGESTSAVVPIRITRDSDLNLKGDDADDLISAIKSAPETLAKKLPSRLETEQWLPFGYTTHLVDALSLIPELVYDVPSPIGLADLKAFPVTRPELKFPVYEPSLPAGLADTKKIFSQLADRDIMLFTPYDSFEGLTNFLNAAANDSTVQKIQMTLYRLGSESPVVDALIAAARNGKDVTAVIELKASFDEEENFQWATTLTDNGVSVIHGLPDLKVHAKCCLVTRLEDDKPVRYATVSTGNYNAKTAKIYSDISLFTADSRICRDLSTLFSYLAGDEKKPEYKQLIVSPDFMEDELLSLIRQETAHHKSGSRGYIVLKTNSLTHRPIINALYEASDAGVKIDLIVRGICMLRPGVPGLSENIRVTSVVGRFLEHSRIFYFRNDGDELVFIGSPDMMSRNLKRRVEIICPVHDRRIKNALINKVLPTFIRDTVQGYVLEPNGVYLPPKHSVSHIGSQQQFIEMRNIWW
ncbi:polyphosphate kinase 1 [Methanorbis furvi]|uniref:Polyphosphate kinase n=1 Tax=Methanorbis furvi TaxID=3028299 RepID=A0AAE4MDH5_9EURY|nr:Polyphosphate kinase [Methanocorpusculaceae archaeon Ag1]